ncbi:uncharacterized protein YbjT (DUF2867 family) [Kibdelosporangium banguiense]|uniref:Uncharacterized protein YbjT (DUF2867 family) n=1 Tax=Kibdelosporangium banguiense TaxID=1365924 RepID=A0ABS4TT81_9PSEU|nr:NmrA/HSCARG family protein [Kibdelosporangium banguiense]MBP2327615.1 uncharacterized protein YbjT (DUF2867 family) [Kibdelosporangium banguiense]
MILVLGATGQQGGATARHLIARGTHVRVLVRDTGTPAAQALAEAGAEPVLGDMSDVDSLESAMAGVSGVFSVQPPGGDEFELGTNVVDAAAAVGVDHLVYASVAGVDRANNIGSWATKQRIEQHIRSTGLPTTFLQPVKFMENLTHPRFLDTATGQLKEPWDPDTATQVIAVDDIAVFAGIAFADPATYTGQALELAGDELSHKDMAAAITEAIGRTVTYQHLTPELLAAHYPELARNYQAALDFMGKNGGWHADIPALRVIHPGLMDFRTWLDRVGGAKISALFTDQA